MSDQATLDAPTDGTPINAPVQAPAPAAVVTAPAPAPVVAASPAPAAGALAADPAEDKPGYWPADWREKASKGDEKLAKRFGRYASPEAALEALVQAQNRISSGDLKPQLGKDATPEQVAAWRAEVGIPETADKYNVGDLTDTQKEAFGVLFKHAHATNQTEAQVKATAQAWSEIVRLEAEKRIENDKAGEKIAEDALRDEWGAEFRRNWNVIDNMLSTVADSSLKTAILDARGPDGARLGSKPEVIRALLSLALIQNPAGVVVPGSEANPMKGVETRIAEIDLMMRKDRKAYNDPKISGPDGEYQRLIAAREKMKG
jgi:hypothetical protein